MPGRHSQEDQGAQGQGRARPARGFIAGVGEGVGSRALPPLPARWSGHRDTGDRGTGVGRAAPGGPGVGCLRGVGLPGPAWGEGPCGAQVPVVPGKLHKPPHLIWQKLIFFQSSKTCSTTGRKRILWRRVRPAARLPGVVFRGPARREAAAPRPAADTDPADILPLAPHPPRHCCHRNAHRKPLVYITAHTHI